MDNVARLPKEKKTQENRAWHLPLSFITAVFERINLRAIARCACVASSWRDAARSPAITRKIQLRQAWTEWNVPLTGSVDTTLYPVTAAKRGNLVAIKDFDSAQIFDLKTKQRLLETEKDDDDWGQPSAMCFAGELLIVGYWDGRMCGFDLVEGRRSFCVDAAHGSQILSAIEHGEGVVTAGGDDTVKIWGRRGEGGSWECEGELTGHQHIVRCVCAARDGAILVSGGEDTTLRVWSATSRKCMHVLRGHTNRVDSVDAHRDEVVSGASDHTVRFWDLNSGACLRVFDNEKFSAASIAFNGFAVAAACFADHSGGSSVSIDDALSERGAWIWDAETGKTLRFPVQVKANYVWCTDEELVVLDGNGKFRVWDFSKHVVVD
ncbi:hypothetical protein BSKO_02547 [Bryopsis sp. KO-2023]|nr:hypothetical protein BSKO_02547 [Bryopsis sp. KO-2023]